MSLKLLPYERKNHNRINKQLRGIINKCTAKSKISVECVP